jgi:hypothetical protein
MPGPDVDIEFHTIFSEADETAEERAPARLKSRIYSALIAAEQETGPLRSLEQTYSSGRGLCIFERFVQIAPVVESAKSPFFCWVCHGRILGENVDRAPIFWEHCPYADFHRS